MTSDIRNILNASINDRGLRYYLYHNPLLTEKRLKEVNYFNVVGFSSNSDFIPYYSLWESVAIHTSGTNRTIEYSILDSRHTEHTANLEATPITQYDRLYSALYNSDTPKRFKTTSLEYSLYAMKGMVYEILDNLPKIHFLVTIDSSYIFGMDKKNLNYSKFRLYLSSDLVSNPKYKSFYSKINKEVINQFYERGIDVIIVKDILPRVFVDNKPKLKFKSIGEMNDYFKSLDKVILNG